MIKLKKNIPLIDQHDKFGFWGGKFGGSYIPETLKKPVDDLTKEFSKLRNYKNFLKKRDFYFNNYITIELDTFTFIVFWQVKTLFFVLTDKNITSNTQTI